MTRIISTLAPRSLSRLVVALLVLGAMLLGTSAADAALTTGKCLILKRQAWGNLRKCEVTEQVKLLKGKPADLAKCQTKFQEKLAKITDKARGDAIACHYGANTADGTVTDYDTGLQWERKDGEVGGVCFLFVDRVNHCVNATYTWDQAQSFVSPVSTDGTTVPSFLAGSAGWRLPTVVELRTIVDTTVPGCLSGSPCIDPIFGPTVASFYWSATTDATLPHYAWGAYFDSGNRDVFSGRKIDGGYVRAVRAGL